MTCTGSIYLGEKKSVHCQIIITWLCAAFQILKKRLKKSPVIAAAYNEIIGQIIVKGYIRKVPKHEQFCGQTRTRIVFDASVKYEGVSLNDVIYQGHNLQRDLFDILLRFRRFPVAMVCDIAEMYLRIGLSDDDKPYHRFLWRRSTKTKRQISTSSTGSCLVLTHRHFKLSLSSKVMFRNTKVNLQWPPRRYRYQHIWMIQWILRLLRNKVYNFTYNYLTFCSKLECMRENGSPIRKRCCQKFLLKTGSQK